MGRSDVRRSKSARPVAEQAAPLKKRQGKPKESSHSVDELDDEEELHEGEDEAGISQKGIERMMRALGEDGLSEMDLALLEQLRAERGEDEEDEDENEDENFDAEAEEAEDNEDGDLIDDEAEEAEDDEDEDEDIDDEAEEAEDDEDGDLIDDEAEEAEDDEEDGEDEDEDLIDDEAEVAENDGEEDEEDEEDESSHGAPKDSLAASILRSGLVPDEVDEDEDNEDEDEEEDEDAEPIEMDAVPSGAQLSEQELASRHHRIRINHTDALERVYEDFRLDAPSMHGKMPWIETMSLTYDKVLADEVPDVQNDLDRELAFYRQALAAAVQGRQRVLEAGVPFSRPSDYFAEMLKTDEHMERVRQRLLDESASIKASEDAKRQRELKKYGKKIQTEKLLERQRSKKEMEDKVNALKRKRSSGFELDDDEFDVQLEEVIGERKAEARKPRGKMSRQSRDAKYGFGGKKRHQKSNTAESTDAWGGARRKPGPARGKKAQRPGKSKRAARR